MKPLEVPEAIKRVIESLTDDERTSLSLWLEELLNIRESKHSRIQKLKAVGKSFKQSQSLLPVAKNIFRELRKAGWTDRGNPFRVFLTSSFFAVVFFGFQGVGIAAFGGAIGLPLWIELLSNLVFETCRSCGDLVLVCG
ncbi:MAG: hypothetical protein O3A08_13370, partial [Proteobacteria bacterium]|nr:hypothetical protein [Pseudomonadota bacterium]